MKPVRRRRIRFLLLFVHIFQQQWKLENKSLFKQNSKATLTRQLWSENSILMQFSFHPRHAANGVNHRYVEKLSRSGIRYVLALPHVRSGDVNPYICCCDVSSWLTLAAQYRLVFFRQWLHKQEAAHTMHKYIYINSFQLNDCFIIYLWIYGWIKKCIYSIWSHAPISSRIERSWFYLSITHWLTWIKLMLWN